MADENPRQDVTDAIRILERIDQYLIGANYKDAAKNAALNGVTEDLEKAKEKISNLKERVTTLTAEKTALKDTLATTEDAARMCRNKLADVNGLWERAEDKAKALGQELTATAKEFGDANVRIRTLENALRETDDMLLEFEQEEYCPERGDSVKGDSDEPTPGCECRVCRALRIEALNKKTLANALPRTL